MTEPFRFTIDWINLMLAAQGMPPCEDFTRSIPGISREAQACGALERKFRFDGLQTEHLRYHMKDGVRVKMLLGERVDALIRHHAPVGAEGGTVDPAVRFINMTFDVDRLRDTGDGVTFTYN